MLLAAECEIVGTDFAPYCLQHFLHSGAKANGEHEYININSEVDFTSKRKAYKIILNSYKNILMNNDIYDNNNRNALRTLAKKHFINIE
jgi:hypothetical protein